MIIFDENLRDKAYAYGKGYKSDWDKKVDEADVARIAMLITRIAEDRDCSYSDGHGGFSYEDGDIANLLRMVYEAGYNHACDYVKERIMPGIRGLIGYDH